jgi:hypothetical protein
MRQTLENAVYAMFGFAWMVVVAGFVAALALPPTAMSDEGYAPVLSAPSPTACDYDDSAWLPHDTATASVERIGSAATPDSGALSGQQAPCSL